MEIKHNDFVISDDKSLQNAYIRIGEDYENRRYYLC